MTTVLRYPYTAITNETDYLQLDIVKYTKIGKDLISGPNANINTVANNVGRTPASNSSVKEPGGVILLPMPSNIQDGNSVRYADDSLNGIVAGALTKINRTMELDPTSPNAAADAATAAGGLIGLLGDPQVKEAYLRSLAASAVNIFGANVTPDQLLARQSGEIFNPNMELLFNGVTLRSFKFSFKMTPRNSKESNQVKQIIRSLKQNMAPKTGSNKDFLMTPNIFELRYRKGNGDHPFLHRFKQCALSDISVNYTGENIYATYGDKDATPVSMIMDLTFRELSPIYNEDYDKVNSGEGVGY
jgi:hypothetical protein